MDGFVQTLQAALGARESVIAVSAPDESKNLGAESNAKDGQMPRPVEDRAVARELAAALDHAVDLGQWELAERIAQQSMRIAREHPLLAERLARLRATRGEFEGALAIIDACRPHPASMRLLRTVCLLQTGRRHEAHADLLGWARRSSAPLQARLILGLLEWDAGNHDDAVAALQHNLRQIEDPHALTALMLMAASQGRRHMAELWADRLQRTLAAHAHRAFFEAALVAAGFVRPRSSIAATPDAAATLATELLAQEHLIPALAEAQQLSADEPTGRLLVDALERAADEVEDQSTVFAALSDLHERMGASDLAEAWRSRARDARRDDVIASIGRGGVMTSEPFAVPWREEAA